MPAGVVGPPAGPSGGRATYFGPGRAGATPPTKARSRAAVSTRPMARTICRMTNEDQGAEPGREPSRTSGSVAALEPSGIEALREEVQELIREREQEGVRGLADRLGPTEWAEIVPRLDPAEIAVLLRWLPDDEIRRELEAEDRQRDRRGRIALAGGGARLGLELLDPGDGERERAPARGREPVAAAEAVALRDRRERDAGRAGHGDAARLGVALTIRAPGRVRLADRQLDHRLGAVLLADDERVLDPADLLPVHGHRRPNAFHLAGPQGAVKASGATASSISAAAIAGDYDGGPPRRHGLASMRVAAVCQDGRVTCRGRCHRADRGYIRAVRRCRAFCVRNADCLPR